MTAPIDTAMNFMQGPMPGGATLHRIRFASTAEAGQTVLMSFRDPAPRHAIDVVVAPGAGASAADEFEVLVVPVSAGESREGVDDLVSWVAEAAGDAPPLVLTMHGAQIVWGRSRSALVAAADRATSLLLAMVDFHYHERELRRLEHEVHESWPLLEIDRPLARAVVVSDPEAFEKAGERMERSLERRLCFVRLAPHLFLPRPNLPPLANQLIDRLRERMSIEVRHETLEAQLEVSDRIYEMNSQRISDFKAAQQQRTMEWIIIVLLAAETVLLLLDLLRASPAAL